jgi:hypothetical protein
MIAAVTAAVIIPAFFKSIFAAPLVNTVLLTVAPVSLSESPIN